MPVRTALAAGLFTVTQIPFGHAADGCTRASDQATLDGCASADFQRADAALNAAYQQITRRLAGDAPTLRSLVTAQRLWLSFRDAECRFATSGSADGSVYPMIASQCRAELTRRRTTDLKTYLNCQEGDLSCPVPPG